MNHLFSAPSRPLLATIGLSLALAGCETTFATAEVPPGATGKTDKPVFDGEGRLIDPRADSDGDGIPDGEEIAGWIVTVDGNGFAVGSVGVDSAGNPVKEALEVRFVTSDPRYADTDGDGLNDGLERMIKSDPRRIDTDGDTLSDYDEYMRWATSPSSADTDGDARGGDPNNPRPPLFALFDAAELRLMKNPLDPNGPLIPGPGATSPLTNDTDGDGVLDYDELLAGTRRATFAEVPKVKFVPTPGAQLDLYFNVTRSDGTTETTSYGTTRTFEEGGSLSLGHSTRLTLERSDYVMEYVKTKDTGGCCLNVVKSETEAGLEYRTDSRIEQTLAWTADVETYFNLQHAKSEAESFERMSGVTFSSGTIRIPLDVVNTGPVPVRMEDLVVSVTRYDRIARQIVPVTEIAGEDMSLASGERRTLHLAATDVPVQAMRDLMADPSSLIFDASRFSLLDQYGLDFDFRMSDVMAYSAAVTIDYGDRSERFFIAASVEPEGVSLGMALTQAGIPYSAEPFEVPGVDGEQVWAITIAGRGTELHDGPAPDLQERFPYPPGLEPGRRMVKRGWFGAIRYADDNGETEGPYEANLFNVMVRPGDEVTIIYSEDLDRDGVSAYDEARWGSSDQNPHSDGDGMSDYWETRVGWIVETTGRAPYRVFSSPIHDDTDRDGLTDDQEAETGLNEFGTGLDPWLADTDQDGFSDFFEYFDLAYGLDPLRPTDIDAIPRPEVTCRIDYGGRAKATDPYYYIVHAEGTDPQGDLVEVMIDFGGPVGLYQSEPTDRIQASQYLERCFEKPETVRVKATDALGFTAEGVCVWAEGAPHHSDPCNGVDDDCNGVVDDGCPIINEVLLFDQPVSNPGWVASSTSGSTGSLDCAPNLIQGMKVYFGNRVDKLGAYCTTPRIGQPYIPDGESEYVYPVIMDGHVLKQEIGGSGADHNSVHLNCRTNGSNTGILGFLGRAAVVLDAIAPVCSSMVVRRINGTWALHRWWTANFEPQGGSGGSDFSRDCPEGSLLTKLNLRTTNIVENVSGECARPTIRLSPLGP